MSRARQHGMFRRLSIEFAFALAVSCAAIAFLVVPTANSERPSKDIVSHGRVDVAVHPFDPNITVEDRFNDVASVPGGPSNLN